MGLHEIEDIADTAFRCANKCYRAAEQVKVDKMEYALENITLAIEDMKAARIKLCKEMNVE